MVDIYRMGEALRLVSLVGVHLILLSTINSEGGIVHCRFLGDDFVIINDVKIVHELLEQRSAIYADRPSVSFVES